VSGAGAAQLLAETVLDRVVVHQVQADGPVARAGVDGDRVGGAAAADRGLRRSRHSRRGEHEVGEIDAAHALGEGDVELDAGRVRGRARVAVDRLDGGRRVVAQYRHLTAGRTCGRPGAVDRG